MGKMNSQEKTDRLFNISIILVREQSRSSMALQDGINEENQA